MKTGNRMSAFRHTILVEQSFSLSYICISKDAIAFLYHKRGRLLLTRRSDERSA